MLDDAIPDDAPEAQTPQTTSTTPPPPRSRRRAASRPAGPPAVDGTEANAPASDDANGLAATPPVKRTRRTTRTAEPPVLDAAVEPAPAAVESPAPAAEDEAPVRKPTRRRSTKAAPTTADADALPVEPPVAAPVLFQAPAVTSPPAPAVEPEPAAEMTAAEDEGTEEEEEVTTGARRRRRRGGRRRRKSDETSDPTADSPTVADVEPDQPDADVAGASAETLDGEEAAATSSSSSRRRRRRRRKGEDVEPAPDDPATTVVRVREPRRKESEIGGVEGSTRLEAKKQRRRDGRDAGRRRVPVVSEAEFLARRELVKREMVVRARGEIAQIAVVEDAVLVEHYVSRESQTSQIGNVYLGRVQNVLPSMEAAFLDIGKGRNGVLYAGEVDWQALGHEGKPRLIEDALKSGQSVLVQVTKDPVGHKGARLTSQISLAGRFLVYLPGGHTSGISRKLPDTERNRLKDLTKGLLPDDAGVIIRTAAEGASEEQLTRDVTALTARWDDISAKAGKGKAPQLLYGEPDLLIKVVRDLFNEDFRKLVIDGADAWDNVQAYVSHVAPDLADRLERWEGGEQGTEDVFAAYRISEQIAKGIDRKVFLPSGGSLVIDRTEAMTVVDVNTGKFTGSGGNLEETVTRNNLEAAEEVVRQLRLRDIGGIIVIDFIDMVLERNRDLVLRRLVESLGRDRTRHQVAEVTSLGLVQMTRKRIGTGLLEAFSEPCPHCEGRGVLVHADPVEPAAIDDGDPRARRRTGSPGAPAALTVAVAGP